MVGCDKNLFTWKGRDFLISRLMHLGYAQTKSTMPAFVEAMMTRLANSLSPKGSVSGVVPLVQFMPLCLRLYYYTIIFSYIHLYV